ncbi:MAG: FAD-dependent oxidoreductase [Ancalomicrobiaceae bacterium]|nr:FAD-dependent oxidoreductase [Ancalomicrobiaceae bacterium]
MTEIAYGVWQGVVRNSRTDQLPSTDDFPELKNFAEFNEGNPVRAFFGDKGFFVFDDKVSLVDSFWHYFNKAAEQSCGKCTPCRVGTVLVRDALDAMRRGLDSSLDLDQVQILAEQMRATSLCGLGQTCANAFLDALTHFRDRIEAEIARKVPIRAQNAMTYMTAPCIEACPSKINVPRYIDYIRDGRPAHSLGVILQKYPMAATCGRVCVRFCEIACRRNLVDEAVGIKTLKRYVADQQKNGHSIIFNHEMIAETLKPSMKVAVIGAGPAGISCAYHLLLHGYHVDVIEAMDTGGGMAAIGIPSYRLPKDVLKSETDIILALGGRFLYNQALGRDYSIDDLFKRGYKAVFLGLGCQQGTKMGVADEDPTLEGYESGIGFLLKVHDHVAGTKPVKLEGKVVVVGGGNVAMDCVRSAIRMGASSVHLVYRRTEADMPADHEEVEAAHAEGIFFHVLTNPSRILSENGKVTGVELVSMEQTDPDARGRRNVKPIPGSEHELQCSTIIAAIGQQVQSGAVLPKDGVKLDRWNCIDVDQAGQTSRPGVFAGGDCASGPSTLISAMAAGLKAARSIDDWIKLGHVRFFPRSRIRKMLTENHLLVTDLVEVPVRNEYRVHHPELDPEVRKNMFEEVEQTISPEAAYAEAKRCLRCYRVYEVITEQPIPEGAA